MFGLCIAILGCVDKGKDDPPTDTPDPEPSATGSTGTLPTGNTAETGTTDPFVVDDVVVSDPSQTLKDPELDDASLRLVWQVEEGGNVWVADVDPATGEIVPPNGEGVLVATDAIPFATVHNGPEWLHTAQGSEVLYARDQGGWQVMRSAETSPGTWETTFVIDGVGPFGSVDDEDRSSPKVMYSNATFSGMWWTTLDGTDGSQFLPEPVRHYPTFIPDTDWLVFTGRPTPTSPYNIARQDTLTKQIEQLTDCPLGCTEGTLFYSEAQGEWLLATILHEADDAPTRYVVMNDSGSGPWQILKELVLPQRGDLRMIVSPEVFTYQGRGYVLFALSTHDGFGVNPSEIWLAGLDPGNDLMRRVSGETSMVRKDPEHLVTDSGVWAYYSEDIADFRILHRCATGL